VGRARIRKRGGGEGNLGERGKSFILDGLRKRRGRIGIQTGRWRKKGVCGWTKEDPKGIALCSEGKARFVQLLPGKGKEVLKERGIDKGLPG